MSVLKDMERERHETGPASATVVLEIRANCPDCSGKHRALGITTEVKDVLIRCPMCQKPLFKLELPSAQLALPQKQGEKS